MIITITILITIIITITIIIAITLTITFTITIRVSVGCHDCSVNEMNENKQMRLIVFKIKQLLCKVIYIISFQTVVLDSQ